MPPLLTPEQMATALVDFTAHTPPASLYRFHSPSSLSALSEGKLKITPPAEFNDPFELSPGIVGDSPGPDDMRLSFLSPTSLAREVFRRRFANEQAYRDWVEQVVIKRNDLWGQHLESLRDSVTQATSSVYGITCFSAFSEAVLNGPLGIRHWAMYARNHTGFVIEYDGQHPLLKNWATSKWLFPVIYHVERSVVSISEFSDWSQERTLKVLRQWSEMKCKQAWGDEMEWRLVCPLAPDALKRVEISALNIAGRELHFLHLWKPGTPDDKRENATAIRRVILGARIDPGLEAKIKSILKSPDFQHVKLERAVLCEKTFGLRTEAVAIAAGTTP